MMKHANGQAFSPKLKCNSLTAKDQKRHLLSPDTSGLKFITENPKDGELPASASPCIPESASWEKSNTRFRIVIFT